MNKLIDEIAVKVQSLSEEKSREFTKKMIPCQKTVYGVKTPQLKIIIKELRLETKAYSLRDKIELGIGLVHTNIFELGQIGYEFIGLDNSLLENLTVDDLNRLNVKLDNWASVDIFAVYVLGKAWRKGIVDDEYILKLVNSQDFWQRRLAVVCTVALNRKANGGTCDPDRTILICKKVVEDYEDMVVKALSWALRELLKRKVDPVVEFIDRYNEILHKRVIREVHNKLKTGLKNPK